MAEYVGVLRPFERGGIVDTGDSRIGDIWVPEADLNGAPFGMKVICEAAAVLPNRITYGRIVEVLGDPTRPDVAIRGIIRSHGLREHFPAAVLEEAGRQPRGLEEADIQSELRLGRKDLRTLRTLTIDGRDAKDLDDAVSIEKQADGCLKLYVHIADVTHYVKEGGALDLEARLRGTSVYLVDRVLPMQPPQLSNGICSLNPQQDRFALTATLVYDSDGGFLRGDVFESVIRSDVRGNYDDVWEMIQKRTPLPGYEKLFEDILLMYDLSRRLRQKRLLNGSLNFDFPETKVDLDENGRPLELYPYPQTEANELIEEFMIAANILVAKKFRIQEAPFIYRVHEAPNPERLERFYSVAKRLGVQLRRPATPTPQALSLILEEIKKQDYSEVLSYLLLQALAKARYDSNGLGHFGLGLRDYCHFTAPIRRYPDLFIHRVIKGYLHGNPQLKRWKRMAQEVADHSSETERNAMAAERETLDQKIAEYLAEHLGETFAGRISGLSSAGMYVRLENSAEGMVPFRTMDDYYIFSEEQMLAQGEAHGLVFRIGDPVTVTVARADIVSRQVDFELQDEAHTGKRMPRQIDQYELERIREAAEQRREERRLTAPASPEYELSRRRSAADRWSMPTVSNAAGNQKKKKKGKSKPSGKGEKRKKKASSGKKKKSSAVLPSLILNNGLSREPTPASQNKSSASDKSARPAGGKQNG
jgi:ribonuclease R